MKVGGTSMTCKRLAIYFASMDPNGLTPGQVLRPCATHFAADASPARIQIQILADVTSAIDEVSASRLSGNSKEKHIERLKDVSEKFVLALQSIGAPNKAFGSAFPVRSTSDYLETLADAVEGEEGASTSPLDRQEVISSIDELVSAITGSALDRVAQKAIILQLSSIQKICIEASVFSDAELRIRIKAIMADLIVSWSSIRAQDEKAAEKVRAWVWGAAVKVRSGLGLAADVTQLTALLPPS